MNENEVDDLLKTLRRRIGDERGYETQRLYAEETGDVYDERYYRQKRDNLGLEKVRARLIELGVEISSDLLLEPPDSRPSLEEISSQIRPLLPKALHARLEEFICGDEGEQLRDEWEEALFVLQFRSEWFPDLYESIYEKPFHITTSANWKRMLVSKEIQPSGAGNKGMMRYNEGCACQAEKRGAVALFDFEAAPVLRVFTHLRNWLNTISRLLQSDDPELEYDGVLIELDRETLPSSLLKGSLFSGCLSLQHVEFHHVGPIPLHCISRVFEIRARPQGPLMLRQLETTGLHQCLSEGQAEKG